MRGGGIGGSCWDCAAPLSSAARPPIGVFVRHPRQHRCRKGDEPLRLCALVSRGQLSSGCAHGAHEEVLRLVRNQRDEVQAEPLRHGQVASEVLSSAPGTTCWDRRPEILRLSTPQPQMIMRTSSRDVARVADDCAVLRQAFIFRHGLPRVVVVAGRGGLNLAGGFGGGTTCPTPD